MQTLQCFYLINKPIMPVLGTGAIVGATFGYVFVTSPSVVFTNQRSLFRPQLVFFQAFFFFFYFIFVFILEDGGKANAFFSVTKLPIDTRNVIETGTFQSRAKAQIGQDQNGEG